MGAFRSHRFPEGGELHYIKKAFSVQIAPDLIVASFGPYTTLICALILKIRFPKAKLWIDYRDLYYNNPNYIGLPIIRHIEKAFNYIINRLADQVTTVSKGLADDIPGTNNALVIYNDAEARQILPSSPRIAVRSELVLGYFGTFYNYYETQGLISFIQNAELVRIILAGDCTNLVDILKAEELQNLNIEYIGKISKELVIHYQSECDREIYFSSGHVGRGILSGKIFEYAVENTKLLVVGKVIDFEVSCILNKIEDVVFEEGSMCPIDSGNFTDATLCKSFHEVISAIII